MPYSILFIDQVDQASNSDLNALMSLLNDGVMTGVHGHKIIFSNSIVMIASDVGKRDFIVKVTDKKFTAELDDGDALERVRTLRCSKLCLISLVFLF